MLRLRIERDASRRRVHARGDVDSRSRHGPRVNGALHAKVDARRAAVSACNCAPIACAGRCVVGSATNWNRSCGKPASKSIASCACTDCRRRLRRTRRTPARRARMSDNPRQGSRPPLAVALHYRGSGAPRVVAKGGGAVAARIIETAREHNVPCRKTLRSRRAFRALISVARFRASCMSPWRTCWRLRGASAEKNNKDGMRRKASGRTAIAGRRSQEGRWQEGHWQVSKISDRSSSVLAGGFPANALLHMLSCRRPSLIPIGSGLPQAFLRTPSCERRPAAGRP